ncbi:MAG TPA: glycoside hydrolase family 16 protein [Candidatus Dormibacteraeota bacterium]|nr:glycoside hydrolase family 16 protein [Candidatus Dormibacteraeota bacterium]
MIAPTPLCLGHFRLNSIRVALLVLVLIALGGHAAAQTWTLSWSDEFNGAANSAISSSNWTYDAGILNVNNEVEYYCVPGDSTNGCDPNNPNVYIDGSGHLVIQALRITTSGAPYSGSWTSARLKSQGLQSFQYGRIESSMSLPLGPGLWPAFWALGSNITSVGWPASGEVDYMENVPAASGLGPNAISSTLHGGNSSSSCYCGGNGLSKHYTFPSGDVTSFHTYGAIWSPNMVQFYVDDPANIFFVRTASDLPSGFTWDFNHPFFQLLNLAVGGSGSWPGPPDNTTPSPAVMVVDYVRLYTPSQVTAPSMTAPSVTVKAGYPGTTTVTLTSTSGSGRAYLSCSSNAPKTTCAVNSSEALNQYTVDFSGATTAMAGVSLTTTANTAAAASLLPGGMGTIVGVLLAGFVILPLARLRPRPALAVASLLLVSALLVSCGGSGYGGGGGGGGSNGTPPGNYTISVNAYTISNTTGNPDAVLSVPLTVN